MSRLILPLPDDAQRLIMGLALQVKSRNISQLAIHRDTGVDQSQISRILSGKAKRYSENVKKLCNYAKTVNADLSTIAPQKNELVETLLELWDGTPEQARKLISLLHAVKSLTQ